MLKPIVTISCEFYLLFLYELYKVKEILEELDLVMVMEDELNLYDLMVVSSFLAQVFSL